MRLDKTQRGASPAHNRKETTHMEYELNCKITPKQAYKTRVKYDYMTIRVNIYDTKGFDYGNRKGLAIQVGDDTPDLYDIRYDPRYTQENELAYVIEFVTEYARNYLIFNIDKIMSITDF